MVLHVLLLLKLISSHMVHRKLLWKTIQCCSSKIQENLINALVHKPIQLNSKSEILAYVCGTISNIVINLHKIKIVYNYHHSVVLHFWNSLIYNVWGTIVIIRNTSYLAHVKRWPDSVRKIGAFATINFLFLIESSQNINSFKFRKKNNWITFDVVSLRFL